MRVACDEGRAIHVEPGAQIIHDGLAVVRSEYETIRCDQVTQRRQVPAHLYLRLRGGLARA